MKKYLSLLLIAVMVITLISGCGKAVDKNKNVVNGVFTEYLVAEKIGNVNRDDFFTADGGLYYKGDNDLWGVMSLNGAFDTGAIYTDVSARGKYFHVYTQKVSNDNDIAGLNSSMLIDGKGRVIVPSGYACFYALNDRFVKAVKVTERCYIKDNAVASRTDNGLCFDGVYGSDSALYSGNWCVFDILTGKTVPGATGSSYQTVTAVGSYVTYKDASGNTVRVNEKGEALVKDAKVFDNGSYSIEGKVGEVYDENGKLLFSYDLTGYKPTAYSNGYYIASQYVDGASKYAVMNKEGKIISSDFESYITIYGDLVHCDDKVYNLTGDVVLEGTYESVYYDKMFGQNWLLRNDKYYTLIDKNGSVFFNGPDEKNNTVWTSEFLASKKIEDEYYYYSYKDLDFTIKGSHFAPWIVKTANANSLYDLVDTMTGKKLVEGYSSYDSVSRNSLAYYVYAKYNGGADVYLVVSGAQLAEVTQKKSDLFDDLSAEFAKQGLTVTVNKESGEIALDSSVLFGGDSAELTAAGKTFLNKFIKAYTTVAFSAKYDGFISKTMVEGHTAPIEGSTYASGLQLSEQRAANVKNYCLSAETGVDVSKINKALEGVGYSNSKPVKDANGNVDLAASRRVSFRFMVNVDF